MEKEKLKQILLDDLQTDFTWLGFIISLAGDVISPNSKYEEKILVLEVLEELLSEGFIRAGMFGKDGGFCAWEGSVSKIMQKIEREWTELGRDPDINEIAWFSLPKNVTYSKVIE